jgi:hypothetical protein
MARKNHRHKVSDSQSIPTNPSPGLSSRLNWRWARAVLNKSTAEDIAELLREVGYRAPAHSALTSSQIQIALEKHVAAYLVTSNGAAELSRMKQEALRCRAEKWLESDDAYMELQELKASLIAREVASDKDVFEVSCRLAIEREVARWLNSPAGQEAVEQERIRVARARAQAAAASNARGWIDREVSEVK